jgi:hypothetical protein
MNCFVNRIIADKWSGALTEDEVIVSPTFDDLRRVIESLDANVKTSVFLEGENGAYLAVGGGSGQYIVYVSPSDQQFWNLIANRTERNEKISLVVGGQDGDYAARQVVDKNSAIKAAKRFFLKGELDRSLHWELQK